MAKRAPRADVRRRVSAPPKRRGRKRVRPHGAAVLLRWCVIGVFGLVGFLYYRPISSYLETRATVGERAAEVSELRQERSRLQTRLEHNSTRKALEREARLNGYVRPGERLFVVKGIAEWRRASRAATKGEATIGGDG